MWLSAYLPQPQRHSRGALSHVVFGGLFSYLAALLGDARVQGRRRHQLYGCLHLACLPRRSAQMVPSWRE